MGIIFPRIGVTKAVSNHHLVVVHLKTPWFHVSQTTTSHGQHLPTRRSARRPHWIPRFQKRSKDMDPIPAACFRIDATKQTTRVGGNKHTHTQEGMKWEILRDLKMIKLWTPLFSAFTVNRLSELEATNFDMNEMNDVKEIDRDLSGQITIIPKPNFSGFP